MFLTYVCTYVRADRQSNIALHLVLAKLFTHSERTTANTRERCQRVQLKQQRRSTTIIMIKKQEDKQTTSKELYPLLYYTGSKIHSSNNVGGVRHNKQTNKQEESSKLMSPVVNE